MSDMNSKIISNLISGRPWTYQEFWDALPDVVYSTDAEEKPFGEMLTIIQNILRIKNE